MAARCSRGRFCRTHGISGFTKWQPFSFELERVICEDFCRSFTALKRQAEASAVDDLAPLFLLPPEFPSSLAPKALVTFVVAPLHKLTAYHC